jgi:hypothetical protein
MKLKSHRLYQLSQSQRHKKMPTASPGYFEEALLATKELLALVKKKDWEIAASLEEKRYRLIRQGIAGLEDDISPEQLKYLRAIRLLGNEILSISRTGRDEVKQQLRLLHIGNKANQRYHQV